MLKDRGKKKWMGFFMPEHVKLLRDFRHDYEKAPRPELDEEKIEEMERLLLEGLQNKILLEITTWKNGFFSSRVGTVTKIDPYEKVIIIQDEFDSSISLNFYQITNVTLK